MQPNLKKLEQLKKFLWTPQLGYCLIYQSRSESTLHFSKAVSRVRNSDEEYRKLGEFFQEAVSRCYKLDANGIINPESFRPTNPENTHGQRWWGFIVASGKTRKAGYVIVATVLAKMRSDVDEYIAKIQHIMEIADE